MEAEEDKESLEVAAEVGIEEGDEEEKKKKKAGNGTPR